MSALELLELKKKITEIVVANPDSTAKIPEQIIDMLLGDYRVDPHPVIDHTMSDALCKTAFGIDALSKQMNDFVMGRKQDDSLGGR